MRVVYKVGLVVEIEADVDVDGDPETGLEGTVTPEHLDDDNPAHHAIATAVVDQVIGPALEGNSAVHDNVIAALEAAASMIGEENPGEVQAYLHHCVGYEDEIPPVRIV